MQKVLSLIPLDTNPPGKAFGVKMVRIRRWFFFSLTFIYSPTLKLSSFLLSMCTHRLLHAPFTAYAAKHSPTQWTYSKNTAGLLKSFSWNLFGLTTLSFHNNFGQKFYLKSRSSPDIQTAVFSTATVEIDSLDFTSLFQLLQLISFSGVT